MYRRWLYPNFTTPVLVEPEFTDIKEPLAHPVFRKPHPIWQQFEVAREAPNTAYFVQHSWEIPRKKPWLGSEFIPVFEPILDVLPPWVQGSWEYPYKKTWVRPGLGPNPNPAIEPFLGINWQVPFAIPVHPKPLTHIVIMPEPPPPPPELPNPLPFPEWIVMRRRPRPHLWQPFVGNGEGFGFFTRVDWEIPNKKPWSGNAFEPVDDVPLPTLPAPHIEPSWEIPRVRIMTEYWMPFQGPMEIPEELFNPNTMLCPRPMRRPDTKC